MSPVQSDDDTESLHVPPSDNSSDSDESLNFENVENTEGSNNEEPDYSESEDNVENDFYETVTDDEPEVADEITVPCLNYKNDVEHPHDFGNGWLWGETDSGSSCGPFMSKSSLKLASGKREPEDFFEALFDDMMWSTIATKTNIYA